MTKSKYERLKDELENLASGKNTKCQEFSQLLKSFGFDIRKCSSGGHRVVTHKKLRLTAEDSANYNCGHNLGDTVKRGYVNHFLNLVNTYEKELKEHVDGL